MTKKIDARGLLCPRPVLLAKKAMDEGSPSVVVLVDNAFAVQNLTRLAEANGKHIASKAIESGFEVSISGGEGEAGETVMPAAIQCAPGADYVVFIGKDYVGDGDRTLGYNLLKMLLYTLSEGENPPAGVLFMNAGVRLPAGGEQQVLDSLRTLTEKGVEVLVCGTCLNFFGIAEKLSVGKVSNMYEILSRMQNAGKVITV